MPKPFSKSVIARSIYILPKNDFSKIIGVVLIQILMGLLDLAGVMAIGLLGVLAVSSEGTDRPLENVHVFLKSINVMELDNQGQIIFLASAAVILFVLRTFFSIYFTRRILFFFSARSAQISSNLISRVLSKPALIMQENTLQETLYAVTRGVEFITIYVLATLLVLLADFSMLAIMSVGLFVVDPLTAILTLTNFAAIGFALYKFMHLRAQRLGLKSAKLNVKSNAKITEILESYRESVVRNRRSFYSREIGELRLSLANTLAETNFLPYVSKYIVETAVVMSALMLGGLQFLFHDAKTATATLAVFLAAGTRIAPAVLRIQQGSIQVQIGIGASNSTLELIEKFENSFDNEDIDDHVHTSHNGFQASVTISDLSFSYPNKNVPALNRINLSIREGTTVAIVGPSGAGKSTLVDVILGLLKPDVGDVLISGHAPLDAISLWPGAISYVPQSISIVSGTVRENITLGYLSENIPDELVSRAITLAQLDDFVKALSEGLQTIVGERGSKISGGQRQRLGIARAMLSRPLLLVLDEATSSLDAETEASLGTAIRSLKGSTTVVMIAHRLSTIKDSDLIVYMKDGCILSTGSFEEVRTEIAEFDTQANLLGL